MQYAKIGSVSTGTHDIEVLLDLFLAEYLRLCKVTNTKLDAQFVASTEAAVAGVRADPDHISFEQMSNAADMLEFMIETLNSFAPPYCFFGAHKHDGADYGFWVQWDAIEDDAHGCYASVVKVAAGNPWPKLSPDVEYVMEINDHGNAALFSAAVPDTELWSMV